MAVRAVIVSDGKRGHENQSRVVARMVGDDNPLVMELRPTVRDGGMAEWLLRTRLRLKGGPGGLDKEQQERIVVKYLKPEDNRALRDAAFDAQQVHYERTVVVSTGTPPATFNLVLSARLTATSIVVMTPSMLPRHLFGLNIVPAHDWRGDQPPVNVIVSALALAHFDESAGEHLALQLRREHELSLKHVYWGLALGGPSKSAQWEQNHVITQLAAVLAAADQAGAKLLVTTSRRTPEWCTAWLSERSGSVSPISYLLDAAADPLNPLPGFYALCNRMLVTDDSFSMVSEAVNAGFRVELIGTSPAAVPGKLGRSLAYLREQGMAVEFSSEMLKGRTDGAVTRPWKFNWHYDELRSAVRLKLGL